jgi:hypothetical protein
MESNGKWGHVYFEILIDENGVIVESIITKSPNKLMNDIVLDALNTLSRFKPAYHNGHPIKSKISSRILFQRRTTM